ncbi:MAG TPA: hypothetical protein VF614_08515 [Chthoniobacteraceae bacterium]
MTRHLALTSVVLALPAFGGEPDFSTSSAKVKRFAEDIVYMVSAGEREPYSKRWLSAPRLVVNSTDAELASFVEDSYAEICREAQLGKAGETTLTVHIGPSRTLGKVAAERSRQINLRSGHTYWIWWNEDRSIKDAVVFLCVDQVPAPSARHLLLVNVLGAFGFPSKSSEFEETCLSSKRTIRSELTPLDRRLIGFYHRHVPPGTRKSDLRKLVEASW